MHTVIILSKHSSDLIKDFRYLFKPYLDEGTISFCDWNESGTDLKLSVPDLYRIIKGKKEWRVVVVGTESMDADSETSVCDEKNPFDFHMEENPSPIPKESHIPMIRLSHMLCGYPVSKVKNFIKGYSYYDENTGELIQIRESEISEAELYALSEKYGEQLKAIYMEEMLSEEILDAQKKLTEKYAFHDIRPREVIFIATRRHFEQEDHIYDSWKTQLEMESSNFCMRNGYPSNCRFLCYSITNPENSMYLKELVEFWLSVLTVSINLIPASALQAYRLYKVGLDFSEEQLDELLNDHLNKMEAVYNFVLERMKTKPEYSFEPEDELIEEQRIPVSFEGINIRELSIPTKRIGLSRDCPEDEMAFWKREIREKQSEIEIRLKRPRREIDRASQYLKDRAESFYGDEYELDMFQMADLKDEIEELETKVLENDPRSQIETENLQKEIEKVDKKVKRHILGRMRKKTVIGIGLISILVYSLGFIPYLINSAFIGSEQFLYSLLLVLISLLVIAIGGIVALFLLRGKLIECMQQFDDLVRSMVSSVNQSGKKYENYFTAVCSYMKAQSILLGVKLKGESATSEKFKLRAHKQALKLSIERDEEIAVSFGIKRNAIAEKNVTRFFDERKFPKENPLYYYEKSAKDVEIPLNETGDTIRAPYKFLSKLTIRREDIYDVMKGDRD